MPYSLPLALAFWAITLIAGPGLAKTPEQFVGAAPGQDSSRPSSPAAKPASPKPVAQPAAKAAVDSANRPAPAGAKPASRPAGTRSAAAKPVLDTARVHALYLDGDFDQAIHTLESALKGRKPLNHIDSVFIFKHLGVMYAATPATREKGRYYMLQLISIEPTAKILDMYASDMIYLIFRNVQEEYENKHGGPAARPAADTVPAPPPIAAHKDTVTPPPPARAEPKRNRTLYWAAGGAAVAAGAAGLLFILLDDPQPKKRTIILNE